MKRVVVIGGGTGSFTVLRGIKNIDDIEITSIVTTADSGGSAGVLRDEFGTLPVGDFRQALVALASEEDDDILRELFQHRFSKGGKGLQGHSFGNLYLMALTEILGSEEIALQKASKILNIQGRVYPVTTDNIQLIAEYEDGRIGFGEAMIDEPPESHDGTMGIKKLWVQPKGVLLGRSRKAIESSDLLILGPGDLYTSTLAALVVDNVCKIIKNSDTKIVYIVNLVTKYGQTYGYKASDHVAEIEKYVGRTPDYVLVNDSKISPSILRRYRAEQAYAVKDDLKEGDGVIKTDLVSEEIVDKVEGDETKRSFIRHDSEKIKEAIENILDVM